MFKVKVYRRFHLDPSDSKVVVFRRELSLPFAPFIGLNLTEGDWYGPPIAEVTWSTEAGSFTCTLEPYMASKSGDLTEEEINLWLEQERWELNG